MYIPESVLENKRHKVHWYFETQTDRLLVARPPGLVIVNKKENLPADHRVKLKEGEKRYRYPYLARELKKKKL